MPIVRPIARRGTAFRELQGEVVGWVDRAKLALPGGSCKHMHPCRPPRYFPSLPCLCYHGDSSSTGCHLPSHAPHCGWHWEAHTHHAHMRSNSRTAEHLCKLCNRLWHVKTSKKPFLCCQPVQGSATGLWPGAFCVEALWAMTGWDGVSVFRTSSCRKGIIFSTSW